MVGVLLLMRLARASGLRNEFIVLGDALMVIGPAWTIYALIELINKPECSALEGIVPGLGSVYWRFSSSSGTLALHLLKFPKMEERRRD